VGWYLSRCVGWLSGFSDGGGASAAGLVRDFWSLTDQHTAIRSSRNGNRESGRSEVAGRMFCRKTNWRDSEIDSECFLLTTSRSSRISRVALLATFRK